MALYYQIQAAWTDARKDEKDPHNFDETELHAKARSLEELLADRFEGSLEQYNQGLISASELFTKLYVQAYNPITSEEQETL